MRICKLKNIAPITIIIFIGTIIGGSILNFTEFLMGSPATIKNLSVTIAYLAICILILGVGRKYKSSEIMKWCSVFWAITFFSAILTVFVNATGVTASWAIAFIILFLGQWYGINFFIGSFLTSSIIIALIALMALIINLLSLSRLKEHNQ